MPQVPVYNQEGTQTGTMELDPAVFGVAAKASVLHQVIVAAAANARRAIAHTKTRGEVRGGGKKPWKQKGTGRARHGSIRSPIWVGGGTTFGPRSARVFTEKVNTKVRRAGLRMALSDKVASERFVVLEDFTPEANKTKAAKRVLDTALAHVRAEKRAPKVLLVLPSDRKDVAKSTWNLPGVHGSDAMHLCTQDVVGCDVLIATRAAVERATAQFTPARRIAA